MSNFELTNLWLFLLRVSANGMWKNNVGKPMSARMAADTAHVEVFFYYLDQGRAVARG